MKNVKRIILVLMMFAILLIPSVVFAEKRNVENMSQNTIDTPLEISLDDEETVIKYSEKFKFPFYFKIVGSSSDFVKFKISVDEEKKTITFDRKATSTGLQQFKVSPHKKEEGFNYAQPGAIFNDLYNKLFFKQPLYKIESIMTLSNGKVIKTVLGNSTGFQSDDNLTGNTISNERIYVFAKSGLAENHTMMFSSDQIENASYITVEEEGRFGRESVKKYLIKSASSIQDVTSVSKETYEFSGASADVVYAFWGLTSEILNDNETNTIEEILTKILLSVGSVFRGVITAVGGENLTIDSLIFNQYENTKIGFWDGGGTYVDVFTSVINGWHNAFTKWTAYILVIILVAVGIRAILLAGTPNQKKIQGMVVGWIIAAALLYIGPMFLKYAVMINDAFVATLRDQSQYSIYSVYNTDFLEKYKINFDMQLGEDSETVKLEDQLMGLYGVIEEDLEKNETKKKELEAKLNDYDSSAFWSFFWR